ncbi:MAG: hypothetical protein PHT57_14640 [Rhodoferax sp.]|nr:hypothetical protein [Rhodoferax sp.]
MNGTTVKPEDVEMNTLNEPLHHSVEDVMDACSDSADMYAKGLGVPTAAVKHPQWCAAYMQGAAAIHAAAIQAAGAVEAAQILAAAMDRRTAAIQRRSTCARPQ